MPITSYSEYNFKRFGLLGYQTLWVSDIDLLFCTHFTWHYCSLIVSHYCSQKMKRASRVWCVINQTFYDVTGNRCSISRSCLFCNFIEEILAMFSNQKHFVSNMLLIQYLMTQINNQLDNLPLKCKQYLSHHLCNILDKNS